MQLTHNNLTIRNATGDDAAILAAWWNDGRVMAHAGFPLGIGQTPQSIAESLSRDSDAEGRRLIIELSGRPIGEMNYRNIGRETADIGIKICDAAQQGRGYGRIVLSMLIGELFHTLGFRTIALDTNQNNTRAQHVYESLGFTKTGVRINSWQDQLGQWQTAVDFELHEPDFINFAK